MIPFEPDQRSDLRREAPSVALNLSPSPFSGVGQLQELLTFFLSMFFSLATTRLQASEQNFVLKLGPLLCNAEYIVLL